ncbi:C40 family peptidase [Desulfobacca acetoxidans]|nr:C40 family peptidase [Desulfobacca acetoxidans]
MMVGRLILGTTISLALVLCPYFLSDAHAKSTRKKPSRVTAKAKVKSSKKYSSRSRSSRYYRDRRTYEPPLNGQQEGRDFIPKYYRAGVGETGPLMKIIPQRDGRFVLEPLRPKKPSGSYAPTITDDRKVAPIPRSNDDYSALSGENAPICPRWNFNDLVLTLAKRYQGASYSRGASLMTGSSTDCSGFVQYVCHNFMVDLPRSSSEQAQVGKTITSEMDFSKMLPGDLLFFRRGGRGIGHVGIYLGSGKMIHASSRRTGVTITDLKEPYYINTFVVAKRVFEVKYPH